VSNQVGSTRATPTRFNWAGRLSGGQQAEVGKYAAIRILIGAPVTAIGKDNRQRFGSGLITSQRKMNIHCQPRAIADGNVAGFSSVMGINRFAVIQVTAET